MGPFELAIGSFQALGTASPTGSSDGRTESGSVPLVVKKSGVGSTGFVYLFSIPDVKRELRSSSTSLRAEVSRSDHPMADLEIVSPRRSYAVGFRSTGVPDRLKALSLHDAPQGACVSFERIREDTSR